MNYIETIEKYKEFEKFSTLDYVAVSKFLRRCKNLEDYCDFIRENHARLDIFEIAKKKDISWDMISFLLKFDERESIAISIVVPKAVKDFVPYEILSKCRESFREDSWSYNSNKMIKKLFQNRKYDKNKLISIFYNQMVAYHWEKAATYKLSKENIVKFHKKLKIKNLRKNKHIDQTIIDKLEIFT